MDTSTDLKAPSQTPEVEMSELRRQFPSKIGFAHTSKRKNNKWQLQKN